MRRRTLLASLSTLAGMAGCVGSGEDPAGQPTDDSPFPTEDPTDTPTMTEAPPEPPTATDAFAGFECPSFTDNADETVCFHAADAGSDLLLTAEPEVFDPDTDDEETEALAFVLYNRSERPVSFNPYAWGIERYEDGEWTHVAPDMHPEPMAETGPGETMRWVLPAEDGSSPDADVHPLSIDLDPGVYAFHVTVSYGAVATGTSTDDSQPDRRVELVTLFEVERRVET